MNSNIREQIRQIIEAKAQAQPTPMEFELAYQARVAIDRIRFAIRHTEQFAPQSDPMQEANLQLLDALERLESAERHFQRRVMRLFADLDERQGVQRNGAAAVS